jgi:tetratricopeptide (TPR) repeat protein
MSPNDLYESHLPGSSPSHCHGTFVSADHQSALGVLARYVLALCLATASWSCSRSSEDEFAQHLARGDRYAEQQKYAEAVIEYKNAARASPNDLSVHWKLAQTALKIKEFKTAFSELQLVTTLDANHYEATEMLGQLYLASGQTKEVARIAESLVATHGNRPAGYVLQGRLAAQEGDLAGAIAQFGQAVQRDPSMDEIMVAVGHLYLLQQHLMEARDWYERALQANPDSIDAHMARGNYYFATGRAHDGERDFDRAVSLTKGSEDARLAIAVRHLTQGRPYRAERELVAISKDMQSSRARTLLTELELELGKIEEAKQMLAALLQDGKPDVAVTFLQGRIALAEQRRKEARTFLEEAVKQNSSMAAAHVYLGLLDLLEGRRAAGEERLLQAVKLDPDSAKGHLVLAELYLSENSFAKAEQEAFEVLRRNPAHIQAAVVYADSFLLRDDWSRAEAVYSALLEQLPDNPTGPAKMAILKQRQGFSSQAAALLGEAVKRSPRDPGLMSEYLSALIVAGQQEKAGRLLTDYLSQEPHDPIRWEVAGRFHVAARHPAQAEEALRKAAELAPHDPRPAYQLAQFYLGYKKPGAEGALRLTLERDGTYEPAHTSLGMLLATQGRTEEANAEYRRALELKPGDYVAANNLAANLVDQDASLDEALSYGRLALAAAPSSPAVQDTVGWIYYKKGSLEEAYPLLTAAVSRLGDNPAVRYHHAMVLARRGERALAVAELEAALALSTSFPGAKEAATTLAQLRE